METKDDLKNLSAESREAILQRACPIRIRIEVDSRYQLKGVKFNNNDMLIRAMFRQVIDGNKLSQSIMNNPISMLDGLISNTLKDLSCADFHSKELQ